VADGTLKNYNTIEDFKAADKVALFNEAASEVWEIFGFDVTATEPLSLRSGRPLRRRKIPLNYHDS